MLVVYDNFVLVGHSLFDFSMIMIMFSFVSIVCIITSKLLNYQVILKSTV